MKYFIFLLTIVIGSLQIAESQTWSSLSSPSGFKNVRDLSINNNGDTLYAADEVNLLKSTDGGQTWSPTSSSVASSRVVTSKYNNSDLVFVSGTNFFKRSMNGGSSWTELLSAVPNKPTALAYFTQDPTVILLGRKYYSTYHKSISRSTDAGSNWTQELTAQTTIFDIAINTSSAYGGYALAAGAPTGDQTIKGLYHTENYGSSWTSKMTTVGIGWTAAAVFYSVTVNVEYAGTADGKLYKGAWKSTLTQLNSFPGHNNFGDTIRAIRINPNNYQTVYVVTDRSIYKTTDNGVNWNIVSSGMLDSKGYCLVMDPTDTSTLIMGTRGYNYRSTNSASSWNIISSGTTRTLPLYSVAPSGSYVWPVSNELTISMKYDGSSWGTQRLGAEDSIFFGKHSITFLNGSQERYIFHSGITDNKSMVYLSKDGGVNYTAQPSFWTNNSSTCEGIVVDPSLTSKVFAFGKLYESGNYRNYFISTDYGLNWNTSTAGVTQTPWLCMAPLGDGEGASGSSKYIYAGIQDGGLRRYNGSSWNVLGSEPIGSVTIYSIGANQKKINTIYAGGVGGLWFSNYANEPDDEDVTFSRNWPSSGSDTVKRIVIDPRFTDVSHNSAYIFWVDVSNQIYRSENNGQSYVTVNGTLPAGIIINDLRTDPSDTTVLLIATDKGIYKAQLPSTPTLTSPEDNATNILYCIAGTENLVFSWSSATGATSYDIQIDNNSDFSSPVVNTNVGTNSYSHSSDLTCGTTYYWRVRSSDGTNFGKSPYTASFRFSTNSCNPDQLSAPTLVSPSNGSCCYATELTLTWNSVNGAIKYKVRVHNHVTAYVSGTSYYVTGLSHDTWYSWEVTAINCNSSNPASSTWTFKTSQPTKSPEPPMAGRGNVDETEKITNYQLSQNYPNPFNPTTRFDYALPNDSYVRLRIFNTLGQVVATVVDEFQPSGRWSVEYNADNLPSGIYFYRLEAGSFISIKKMLLMK